MKPALYFVLLFAASFMLGFLVSPLYFILAALAVVGFFVVTAIWLWLLANNNRLPIDQSNDTF